MTAPRPFRPRPAAPARARRAEAGFTVAEMLVTLLLTALVLIAVLALFDMTGRTARTQTHVAEMQQSLRVAQQTLVRMVRMAGRGGLPTRDGARPLPGGVAVELLNNAPAGTLIAGDDSAPVLEGTDVVTVRGVFDSPIYQVNPASGAFSYTAGDPTGSLTLLSRSPTGAPQPLEAVRDAIQAVGNATGGTHPEALLLVSPLGDWAVVELVPGGTFVDGGGEVTEATLQFQVTGGDFSAQYAALSRGGAFPATLETVAYAGLLEEYRFYVREVREVAGDADSLLVPELVRARLYPNTDVAYQRQTASLTQVIADNVLDLQTALGIDHDGDEMIEEVAADGADAADEWLFNAAGDNPADGKWNAFGGSPLYYLRINTLVRTDRAEPYYEGEELATIEDKDYSASPFARLNEEWARRFHRRQMRTVVDLRNL
ncbi:MAG TPA: PilW family protein [Thermoanaerobaculia bacterium]|nr:PilW family protein [Thermoanaerobaculia bacterium]